MRRFSTSVDNKTKAAGIMLMAASSGRFLLALRPSGHYSTIGGYLCWGESSSEGAIREFEEETMYNKPILLLKGYTFQSPVKNFEYTNYVGICNEEFKPDLDEENVEADWFSISQLYAGGLPLHRDFEDFLFESKDLIDSLMRSMNILSP